MADFEPADLKEGDRFTFTSPKEGVITITVSRVFPPGPLPNGAPGDGVIEGKYPTEVGDLNAVMLYEEIRESDATLLKED